jgi:7-cyano-7-deazaguanine tRNA-ribosyltransferase
VLVVIDGERLPGYDDVLLFKPPFGPYPHGLSETFPVGQSEVPPWDEEMVRTGCRAIGRLAETHPESYVAVSCTSRWSAIVSDELPHIEVVG